MNAKLLSRISALEKTANTLPDISLIIQFMGADSFTVTRVHFQGRRAGRAFAGCR
jgi:hypothetical protein